MEATRGPIRQSRRVIEVARNPRVGAWGLCRMLAGESGLPAGSVYISQQTSASYATSATGIAYLCDRLQPVPGELADEPCGGELAGLASSEMCETVSPDETKPDIST